MAQENALVFPRHFYNNFYELGTDKQDPARNAARLRTEFNIPGINEATIGAIKRKSVMKQRFIDAGLAPGRGRVCRDEAELPWTMAWVRHHDKY